MRIAHITDLHLLRPASLRQLASKRLLGGMNLWIAGRAGHFQESSILALVEAVVGLRPDAVVCTGDLTAMANPREFEDVARLLAPITDHLPFVLVPGNHDVYTGGAARERRLEKWFGAHTGGGIYPALHQLGEVCFIGLDPCRSHPLLASGLLPDAQIQALEALLSGPPAVDSFCVLLQHYPLRDANGAPYTNPRRRMHNAEALEAMLARCPQVGLILHGHEHRGYDGWLDTGDRKIPIFNPGAGGYARLPHAGRSAAFNLYNIDGQGFHGAERYALGAQGFERVAVASTCP